MKVKCLVCGVNIGCGRRDRRIVGTCYVFQCWKCGAWMDLDPRLKLVDVANLPLTGDEEEDINTITAHLRVAKSRSNAR